MVRAVALVAQDRMTRSFCHHPKGGRVTRAPSTAGKRCSEGRRGRFWLHPGSSEGRSRNARAVDCWQEMFGRSGQLGRQVAGGGGREWRGAPLRPWCDRLDWGRRRVSSAFVWSRTNASRL